MREHVCEYMPQSSTFAWLRLLVAFARCPQRRVNRARPAQPEPVGSHRVALQSSAEISQSRVRTFEVGLWGGLIRAPKTEALISLLILCCCWLPLKCRDPESSVVMLLITSDVYSGVPACSFLVSVPFCLCFLYTAFLLFLVWLTIAVTQPHSSGSFTGRLPVLSTLENDPYIRGCQPFQSLLFACQSSLVAIILCLSGRTDLVARRGIEYLNPAGHQ